jgi:hypothetical protein
VRRFPTTKPGRCRRLSIFGAAAPIRYAAESARRAVEGDVGEGRREIARLRSCHWIEFLGEQSDVVADVKQPFENQPRLVRLARKA